jgi:hypothetical protein
VAGRASSSDSPESVISIVCTGGTLTGRRFEEGGVGMTVPRPRGGVDWLTEMSTVGQQRAVRRAYSTSSRNFAAGMLALFDRLPMVSKYQCCITGNLPDVCLGRHDGVK